MSKIRVLMCPAERAPYITNIENSLTNMRRVVGGHIEAVTLSLDPEIVLVCNEEGQINGLPLCRSVPLVAGIDILDIRGDCFICGADGEEFADLPEPRRQWLRSAKATWKEWEEVEDAGKAGRHDQVYG